MRYVGTDIQLNLLCALSVEGTAAHSRTDPHRLRERRRHNTTIAAKDVAHLGLQEDQQTINCKITVSQ